MKSRSGNADRSRAPASENRPPRRDRTSRKTRRGRLLTAEDGRLFGQGRHSRLFERLGAQLDRQGGSDGVTFSVWAPHARGVSVIGSFNDWDPERNPLPPSDVDGIWSGFVPRVGHGAVYKFHVRSRIDDYRVDKADPFAFHGETPPATASRVWDLGHAWGDEAWLARRATSAADDAPLAVYELHLGSWKRHAGRLGGWLGYRGAARELADYVERMGFTHVELLPLMEHPFYGSWGYQATSFFAPTARYGTPQDLMQLIDLLHQRGIGVILDWVPSHFPGDEHGLAFFDGAHLFEYPDPRLGFHPDWNSYIFNYADPRVVSFLISSALFWIERYHVDALRVDAVASMLYRDYSRPEGEWVPNQYGGRENLEAIEFLKRLNETVHQAHPGVRMIAEESSSWPMVSRPSHLGGLGFDMKWDLGWMHDTLNYMQLDPIHRKFHHEWITFRMLYAHSENFVLPLSHDEVVHGKGSLLGRMPGDTWQRFANLRALLGYMYALPGKKLLFMGAEIGQWNEWNHERGLEWHLLEHPPHAGLQRWVADLNELYTSRPALHQRDFDGGGFRWIDCSDADQSVICFSRHGHARDAALVVACNFTPLPRHNYRVGVPLGGLWHEVLNSDATVYGGSGVGNFGGCRALPMRFHGLPYSLNLTLPPLSVMFLEQRQAPPTITLAPIAPVAAPRPEGETEPQPPTGATRRRGRRR